MTQTMTREVAPAAVVMLDRNGIQVNVGDDVEDVAGVRGRVIRFDTIMGHQIAVVNVYFCDAVIGRTLANLQRVAI